jgi:poly(A) polymerase
VFPLTAADLMPTLQGAALGEQLRKIEARWLTSDLTLTKAQLLA